MTTLADLTARTGIEVYDHLPTDDLLPVLGGIQAQGDVIVVPANLLPTVTHKAGNPIPAEGVTVLRGVHPHVLVADPGVALWAADVTDPDDLALGVLVCTDTAWLLHPEHGGTGIAAGSYVLRGQREQADVIRRVAD